ncbi:MAG: DUF4097 family beta strand repeat protein [Clostridia bacterium]|nr:DUF4097 family beta strand repeat protein [Clostridia bacterium]
MRPSSIVSIVIAVVLIITGAVLMNFAKEKAEKENIDIFGDAFSVDGSKVVELDDMAPVKIQLFLADAEINIKGSHGKSTIEFINYDSNYYALSTNTDTLSFNENPKLETIVNFMDTGWSFKGIRYFINRHNFDKYVLRKESADLPKVINISLSDLDSLNSIEINASSCRVNISDIDVATDFYIFSPKAEITTRNVVTTSSLTVNKGKETSPSDSVRLSSLSDTFSQLDINSEKIDVTAQGLRITGSSFIQGVEGSVRLDFSDYSSIEAASGGRITVNQELIDAPYTASRTNGKGAIRVECVNAAVELIVPYTFEESAPEE